jgi:hypothetical protein
MKRPNALHPDRMTTEERRAELCSLLALALVRLHKRNVAKPSENTGESSLHFPPDQSVHATPTHRRTA